jgi:capsular exopolysaccharide synthesis family protein
MTEIRQHEHIEQEEGIKIKAILNTVRSYSYLFVLSAIIAFSISYVINRYTSPAYQIKAHVLLSNDQEGKQGSEILGVTDLGGGFNPWDPTFVNDKIQIIKSVKFMAPIVADTLNFMDCYYEKGDIKLTERYSDRPFTAHLIFYQEGLEGTVFELNFQKNSYYLEVKNDKKILFKRAVKFNQIAKCEHFKFYITPADSYLERNVNLNDLAGKKYQFIRHNKKALVNRYANQLSIVQIKNTKALELSIEENNQEKGIDFINSVSKAFVNRGLNDKNGFFSNSLEFINQELDKITLSLKRNELEIEQFKKERGLVSIPEQTAGMIAEWSDLEIQKYQQDLNLKNIQQLKNYIFENQDLSSLAPATFGITDPLLIPLINALAESFNKFRLISRQFKPESFEFKEAKIELTDSKARLLENAKNIEKQSIKIVDEYRKKLNNMDAKLGSVPSLQRQYIGLERQFNVQEKLYLLLLEKKFEYEIARSGNKSDYSILNEAFVSGQTKPTKQLNYLKALALAIVLPSLFIFLRIYLDHKIRSREQIIGNTKMPFLAAIPNYNGDSSLIFEHNTKSMVAESFRNLRTSIQYMLSKDQKCHIILVTSTVGGEGKTFLTLNLAHALALSDKKVLVIGLDLRKPRLHLSFDIKNDVGITNYLIGRIEFSQIIKSTKILNLDIIPSGPVPPNPSELLLSTQMLKALGELRHISDFILLDTAPLGLVTDAADLMPHVDLSIYVMRENYSDISSVQFADEFYRMFGVADECFVLRQQYR